VLKKVMGDRSYRDNEAINRDRNTRHLVRYSLRVLEQQGLIEPSTQGAVATRSAKEAFP